VKKFLAQLRISGRFLPERKESANLANPYTIRAVFFTA